MKTALAIVLTTTACASTPAWQQRFADSNGVRIDYFPAVIEVTEEWAKNVESKKPPLTFDPHLARRILKEQGARDYSDRLGELDLPILVLLGKQSMEPRVEAMYAKAPNHTVCWIDFGHDTFASPEAAKLVVEHLED